MKTSIVYLNQLFYIRAVQLAVLEMQDVGKALMCSHWTSTWLLLNYTPTTLAAVAAGVSGLPLPPSAFALCSFPGIE